MSLRYKDLILKSKEEYINYYYNLANQKSFIPPSEIESLFFFLPTLTNLLDNIFMNDVLNPLIGTNFNEFLHHLISPHQFFQKNKKYTDNLLNYALKMKQFIDEQQVRINYEPLKKLNHEKITCVINMLVCFGANSKLIDDKTLINLADNLHLDLFGNRGKFLIRQRIGIMRILQLYIYDDCINIIISFVDYYFEQKSKHSCLIM